MKARDTFVRFLESLLFGVFTMLPFSAQAAGLDATGASWLFPLTRDVNKNGFCNSPSLASGAVISASQLSSIIRQVSSDSDEQFCSGLTNPVVKILTQGDGQFMSSCNHLAQLNGLRDEIDRATSWHVVGFRFDPCVNATSRIISNRDDFAGCTSEVRLVAQPFIMNSNGTREVIDASLHLIYALNGVQDIATVVQDLKRVQEVTKEVAGASYPPATSFTAHPGLEFERKMGQCNGASAKSIISFFAKHANPAKLTQVAFMTSSGAVKQWSFGVLQPRSSFLFGSTPTGRFDNFSDSLFSQSKFPINRENRNASSIINISKSFDLISISESVSFNESQKADARIQLDLMNDLMNPKVTSQLNQSCIGCHMAPQVFNILAVRADVPQAIGTRPFKNSLVFPDFNPKTRNFLNLRHFGYGSGFEPGVSLRSLNEIDRIRKDLNLVFP